MKKLYILFILLTGTLALRAQNVQWQFHSYHHDQANRDEVYAIAQTSDSDYVVASRNGVNPFASAQLFIFKLDKKGTLAWEKTYDGASGNRGDEARGIKQLPDGSFIISGFTTNLGGVASDTNSYKNMVV